MKQLFIGADFSDKYIYLKRTLEQATCYYIINVKKDKGTKIKTNASFMFYVPNDSNSKCHLYDNTNETFITNENDIIYEMEQEEWLNTYRTFMTYQSKPSNELPSKLIQNN